MEQRTSHIEPSRLAPVTSESVAQLRNLRDSFLADATTSLTGVRDIIARSWMRSAACAVDPDHVYSELRDIQLDQTFLRIAMPVVERLGQMARDTGVCVILSDATGTHAVMRGDRDVMRWADERLAFVGGHMPEDLAGTNSDGTALEEGRSVQVWGPEHYAVALQDTYCTSVPIRDTIRGRIVAVLTLMLPERVALTTDAASVSLLVEGAAAEIGRLATDRLARRERALLDAYMRETRTRGAEAVVAIDGRTTIASARAQSLLTPDDFAVVSGYAHEASAAATTLSRIVELGEDHPYKLTARPVMADGDIVGAVVRFKRQDRRAVAGSQTASSPVPIVPELVGGSELMRGVRLAVAAALPQRSVVFVTGEQGTGRGRLAIAMARATGGEPLEIDCGEGAEELAHNDWASHLHAAAATGTPVVIHHLDQLGEEPRGQIGGLLGVVSRTSRVFVTANHLAPDSVKGISRLSAQEIRLPPLRSRREDIPKLVSHFLALAAPDQALSVSSHLLAALAQAEWPGNIADLRDVVISAAAGTRSTEISASDLGELQQKQIARGRLTRLEAAELEQIRHALVESRGNRARAAQLLGIGRSTLYRKIELYTRRGFDLGR